MTHNIEANCSDSQNSRPDNSDKIKSLMLKYEQFLNANYPCACEGEDPECPANEFEAEELALMAEEVFRS